VVFVDALLWILQFVHRPQHAKHTLVMVPLLVGLPASKGFMGGDIHVVITYSTNGQWKCGVTRELKHSVTKQQVPLNVSWGFPRILNRSIIDG
jgi:hypothetical protein